VVHSSAHSQVSPLASPPTEIKTQMCNCLLEEKGRKTHVNGAINVIRLSKQDKKNLEKSFFKSEDCCNTIKEGRLVSN
jgi:hypothetical protein